MTIPPLDPVESKIDLLRSLNDLIRKAGTAARAENCTAFTKSGKYFFIPPAPVAEFHNVSTRRVEVRNNSTQPGRGITKARWKLKEEATHPAPKKVGNISEVADESLCSRESFDMSYQLRGFDGIDEILPPCLSQPGVDSGLRGPGVEGGI